MRHGLAVGAAAAILMASSAAAQIPYAPAATPGPGASACPHGLCQPEALGGLFEALAATERGERNRPVHILQIGDSHTAGDRITGAVRAALQSRFGSAGRGVVPPGLPYDGYAPYQIQMSAAGWRSETAQLQPADGQPAFVAGLAGMRGYAAAGTSLILTMDPGAEVLLVGVCGEGRDAGADLEISGGGVSIPVDLTPSAEGDRPVCVETVLPGPAETITLRGAGTGATLGAVRLERLTPGVMVSNLGVVGSRLRDLARRDEGIVATELAVWRPQLIVLAYGTNEGFDPALESEAYDVLLRAQIARMRRLAPGASLLILGAPDALRSGGAGGCSADGLRGPPPALAVVRDVQRRVAADLGVAFWDWHGRMGGDCSADRLALGAEPLMRGDRVHFTSAGADWIGGILADDLMAAYDAWKAGQSPASGGAD